MRFSRLEHQTRHTLTHTGEKPHKCQFLDCNKRFSRADLLSRHLRIHKENSGVLQQDVSTMSSCSDFTFDLPDVLSPDSYATDNSAMLSNLNTYGRNIDEIIARSRNDGPHLDFESLLTAETLIELSREHTSPSLQKSLQQQHYNVENHSPYRMSQSHEDNYILPTTESTATSLTFSDGFSNVSRPLLAPAQNLNGQYHTATQPTSTHRPIIDIIWTRDGTPFL
jgi:uncharacterized Zn-finger protein